MESFFLSRKKKKKSLVLHLSPCFLTSSSKNLGCFLLLLLLLLQMHTNEIKLGSFPYSLYSNKRTLQDSLLVLTDLYFFLCDSIANKILAFPCEGVLKKKKKPTCWDLEIFEVSLSNPTSVSSALLSFPHHLFSLTTHANPFFFYRLLSFYFVSSFFRVSFKTVLKFFFLSPSSRWF